MRRWTVAEERSFQAADAEFAQIMTRVRSKGQPEPEDVAETSALFGIGEADAAWMLALCLKVPG